jgi:type VI secretion system protein ImpH
MAGTGGEQKFDLMDELLQNPEQFDFFQAVRLIERAAAEQARGRVLNRIGSGEGPQNEAVKFRALASLSFPPGQISAISRSAGKSADGRADAKLEMTVPFMGLTGPAGVLPDHYTSLVIERSHLRTKDHSLREFFDLFNHRVISLFFRAWEKYRFPFVYERKQQEGQPDDDLFTLCLYCLSGIGSRYLRERHAFDDQAILYFGGFFATRFRNVVSLEQMLGSYFELDAEVLQFQGQWLYLPEESQSSMPSSTRRTGLNLSLGESAVAGSRVWDLQSRIRIRLGPLSWAQFSELLPGTGGLSRITEIIRLYIDINLDFDVQLILRREEVPLCRLTAEDHFRPLLGWNTWIGAAPETRNPACDAVFRF